MTFKINGTEWLRRLRTIEIIIIYSTYIVSVLYIQSNQRSTGSKDACHATGVTDGKMVYTPCKNRRFLLGRGSIY